MAEVRMDFVDTAEIRRASGDIREVGVVVGKAGVACMEVAEGTGSSKFVASAETHAEAAKAIKKVSEATADSLEALAKRYEQVDSAI